MKFQLFQHTRRWTWILLRDAKGHGKTVLAHGARYETEQEAREAIEVLRNGVMRAAVVQLEK